MAPGLRAAGARRRGRRRVGSMAKRYDCAKCPGYCCSYDRIPVSDFDLARLARHFGLGLALARRRFSYVRVSEGKSIDDILASIMDGKADQPEIFETLKSVAKDHPSTKDLVVEARPMRAAVPEVKD